MSLGSPQRATLPLGQTVSIPLPVEHATPSTATPSSTRTYELIPSQFYVIAVGGPNQSKKAQKLVGAAAGDDSGKGSRTRSMMM